MAKNGINTKIEVDEPTSWVNSLVYPRKQNERLRFCLDAKDFNAAIRREHHVTHTLEEIQPKLTGATVLSIVDANWGYWDVVLDKESSYLTTFNSPFGRYRFNCIPFGLKMSQLRHLSDQTWPNIYGVRRSGSNCRRHRSFWQNQWGAHVRPQHPWYAKTMPRYRPETAPWQMPCDAGENQILWRCLWPRWDPTRSKQNLST